jgi:hypothetical protein
MMGVPVIEVIGVLAVIAGLVFVGLEIRQTNRLAQAAAYQVIGSATAQNWHDMSQDPEFNRIWLRHFSADQAWWSDQDPRDVERLISAWIGFLRQYETIHLLVRDQPALQYLWPQVGYAVDPTLAAHITETWSEVPSLTGQLHLGP